MARRRRAAERWRGSPPVAAGIVAGLRVPSARQPRCAPSHPPSSDGRAPRRAARLGLSPCSTTLRRTAVGTRAGKPPDVATSGPRAAWTVLTVVAAGASEAVGGNAAFEMAAKCPFDRRRRCCSIGSAGEFEPGFGVGRDDALPQGARGTAGLAARGRARGAMSADRHRVAPSWSG